MCVCVSGLSLQILELLIVVLMYRFSLLSLEILWLGNAIFCSQNRMLGDSK